MGNGESNAKGNYDKFAYRVINVEEGSPAQKVGIETQLDFIMYNPIKNGNKLFSEFIKENEGREIAFSIYNII